MKAAAAAAGDRCPRCGGGFHCGASGPAPCACSGLQLSAALRLRLSRRFSGCLCLRCLQTLAATERAALKT